MNSSKINIFLMLHKLRYLTFSVCTLYLHYFLLPNCYTYLGSTLRVKWSLDLKLIDIFFTWSGQIIFEVVLCTLLLRVQLVLVVLRSLNVLEGVVLTVNCKNMLYRYLVLNLIFFPVKSGRYKFAKSETQTVVTNQIINLVGTNLLNTKHKLWPSKIEQR